MCFAKARVNVSWFVIGYEGFLQKAAMERLNSSCFEKRLAIRHGNQLSHRTLFFKKEPLILRNSKVTNDSIANVMKTKETF